MTKILLQVPGGIFFSDIPRSVYWGYDKIFLRGLDVYPFP